ncbi:Aspartic proteinase nepenthesin-1 [Glycine soja]|uniref:Aspartic proteinase nepenthesin-1 n=1 Tax=Glycine soja TaxID=3848 RepID=A0A0B2P6G9_GLYSO|nr:Aspartic proteinase nepenthesin-1 [Glycine soja]
MPSSHILFSLLSFLSIIITTFSSSTPNTITLHLSPLFTNHPSSSSHPFHTLKLAVSTSITRAHHLKNHKPNKSLETPVHPKTYGGYSIDLEFGTPSQTFPFVLDTGSTLVWLPCSSHYLCSKCNSSSNTPKFIPKNSSSSKFVGCTNPKCAWVFGPDVKSHCCRQDKAAFNNCSQTCPAYTPAGIAGFGRGEESLPSQMNLTRFSYCLLSHQFDDSATITSNLVLETASSRDGKTNGVSYTPFLKNPTTKKNPAFGAYYYITLKRIVVGEKRVREFAKQVSYTRAREAEKQFGLSPCFVLAGGAETASFPELRFEFRGGAKMRLPVANYFSLVGKGDVACLTIVSDDVAGFDDPL